MTTTADELRPLTRRAGARAIAIRVLALAVLLCASLPLIGCGISVLGRRVDLLGRGPKPAGEKTAGSPEKAQDTKAIAKASAKAAGKTPTRAEEKALDAMGDAREQTRLAPRDPYWPYRIAQLELAVDSTAAAEASLEDALTRDPRYAPALSLLSRMQFEKGRHAEAIQRLEAARAPRAGDPRETPTALLAGLALHYDALDRTEEAAAVLASIPRSGRTDAAPARVYLTLRGASPDSAADLAKDLLRDDSRLASRQNNYGITRLRAGDPAAARRAFLEAIERDPKLPGPYYNLAILEKFYAFDDAAAARWFDRYWERSTEDPDGLAATFGKRDPHEFAENRSPR